MSQYGCTIPRQGRALIAKVLAAKMPLTISRIMMGQGVCPDDVFPADLEDLVEPVAEGTSTEPTYDGDTVHMTVEYRSDLNGGLDHGFWIREFGVFAKDETGAEVMLYYGVLGDYPQWVSAYNTTGLDVRRYPISITIGEGAEVIIDYSPEAFMTAEDVEAFCTNTILPTFLIQSQAQIAAHNADEEAHPSLTARIQAVEASSQAAATVMEITIPKDGWTDGGESDTEDNFGLRMDISVEGVTETMPPFVSIHPAYLETAMSCGLSTTARTMDGILRLYAKSAPAADMAATLTLLCASSGTVSGGGASGTGYSLPAATATRLGGVKVGDGLSVAPDGTLTINPDKVMTDEDLADEGEVAESVVNILNGDAAN